MRSRILIINGHPDPRPERLCSALCDAYAQGAQGGGAKVRRLEVGQLDFPLIETRDQFEQGAAPEAIRTAQVAIQWADHLLIVHPLWQGAAPARLKGFFEQTFRYGFALPRPGDRGRLPVGSLGGRSAHLVVTLGMPAPLYRTVFGGFGVRAFERGVLRLSGIAPIRTTYLGQVEESAARRARWLQDMSSWGRRGE